MVGSGIRKLREDRQWTQKELAYKLGVSRQALCMWESNKRELKATALEKFAQIFDVTVDEIIRINKTESRRKVHRSQRNQNRFKKIRFILENSKADRVILTGDFTGWNKNGMKMRKYRNGIWKASLELNSGRYEYKFIVDDQWIIDPNNQNITDSSVGTQNSVIEVGEVE